MNNEEAIEILRNECINTYAERKALAIQTVLNLIEKQKAEIETLKRDFEIVDHECSRLEQEDIRKDMMINLMANHIATSDSDLCEYLDMTTKCKYYAGENKKTCEQCIKEYFENKVKESK